MARKLSLITKTALVLSSLLPLEILMLIKLWPMPLPLTILFGAGIVLGLFGVSWVIKRAKNDSSFEPRIKTVEEAGPETIGYLVSFILPLIAVQNPTVQEWAAYLVFIVIYVVVLANSQLLVVNPVLYLLGYRIWKIEFEGDPGMKAGFAIARHRPREYSASSKTPYFMTGDGNIFFEYRAPEGTE